MPATYPDYTDIQLSFSADHKIATVTLNRPNRRNAWTPTMSAELADAYAKLDEDADVHVVIMTGSGKAFCFGAELQGGGNPFAGRGAKDLISHRDTGGVASLAIWKCRKVTIAAINGPAIGIGATIVLPMDLRITYNDNKVGFVFAARGIVCEAASSYFLPKLVGMAAALALVTTAQVVSATHDWAKPLWSVLLDSADQVLPTATSMAEDIAKRCSGVAHAVNKSLLWANRSHPEEQHLLDSAAIFLTSERDGKEGAASFLEKREPIFSSSLSDPSVQGLLRHIRARL